MKKSSIRFKITLWFAAALLLIVALALCIVLLVGVSVLQKNTRDLLVTTVEHNVDEIEYYEKLSDIEKDNDKDYYMDYQSGYLEVDDDFLKQVNENYTALYYEDGNRIYGENPIEKACETVEFQDSQIQTVASNGVEYYIYDRNLKENGLAEIWLRGIVSKEQSVAQMSHVAHVSFVLLPFLGLLAIFGGYFIAGKMLRPIQNISQAAEEIQKGGDLKKRIATGKGNDELHQLADRFNAMFGRLDEAFMAEQQFTSDVSHELRTPVSVIMAQCEYSLETPKSPKEYEEALRVIERQGKKMSKLINDMLIFSRLDMGAKNYSFEIVDLTELVSTVCQDMALIQERGITLEWQVQGNVSLNGNQELLTRLLVNLISNSYRYGTENGFILVSLKETQGQIQLSVTDDGMGIPEEELEKIFRRFYQVDNSRNGQGTGLGLAIVAEIAQLHGGTVKVESELGKGSTFIFITPL